MRGAHLLFYSHEPACKNTYDCLLDTRSVYAVNFPARAGTHFNDWWTEALQRERSLILISKRLKVAHLSQAIKASFNHSTKASSSRFC